jgi:hypothetical protein
MTKKKKISTKSIPKLNPSNSDSFIPEEYLEYKGHKPVKLFPDLHNISECLNQSHPHYHPDRIEYERYWSEQERRCIEGLWFSDTEIDRDTGQLLGGYRYMPPQLYFYINFCIIEDETVGKGSVSEIKNPDLRDVDWMLSYGWFAARKFSGFEDDDDYTCHRLVEKIEKNIELTPKEQWILETNKPETGEVEEDKRAPLSIYKKDGSLKKYIDARDYLYQTHDRPLGLPLYENEALNFFVLGSRGFGKSYFTANAIIGHEYNFSGQTRFGETPQPKTIFVGAADSKKSTELLTKFDSAQQRRAKEYGAWGKGDDFIPGYFYMQFLGTLSASSKSPYRHEYKYKEGGNWVLGGSGTKILHTPYTSENPQAAVGNRCSVMVIEEVGLADNLLAIHAANETTMIRRTKFGSAIYIGTGGNMEKVVESKVIFEDPEQYNFLAYKDLWEGRSKPIGFFLPAYYVDSDYKDKKGNTNVKQAFAQEVFIRRQKEKATNSLALDGYIMARPIIPAEMFLSTGANVFPAAKLRARESKVDTRGIFKNLASIGSLHWNRDQTDVHWVEDLSPTRLQKPICHLNLDTYRGNLEGSVVIFEHPVDRIPNPTYFKSLYKVCYDPVKDDGGGTSLACIIVYKGYSEAGWNQGIQNGIVAEYVGRYDKVSDIHEIALKLAYYYNALILYENNIQAFQTYCENKKFLHKLMIEPQKSVKKVVQTLSSKKPFGADMTPPRLHTFAEQLIREWLLEEWKTEDDGNKKLTIDSLNSLRMIRELTAYEPDKKGQFDYVSALKLLMLWLAHEREGHIHKENEGHDRYKNLTDFSKSLKKTYLTQNKNPWFS